MFSRRPTVAVTFRPPPAPDRRATPAPLPEAAQNSDAEAADLVDEALAALLQAGSGAGDIGLFVSIADMAERADALIGSGTSLGLVETLLPEAN